MTKKALFMNSLLGAFIITGCVSVKTLEQDINSNDTTRKASAAEKNVSSCNKRQGRLGEFQ